MRDPATDQEAVNCAERWEQMICQINYQVSQLFKLNNTIGFYPSAQKSGKVWQASTYQTGDLFILDVLNEKKEEMTVPQARDNVGMDENQIRNIDYILDIKDNRGKLQYYSLISKLGTLGNILEDTSKNIYIYI